MVCLMLPPYFMARAIDDGLRSDDLGALTMWSAAVFGAGLLIAWFGIARHRAMTMVRMDATFRTIRVVVRQAVRLGATLPQKVTAGEVVSIGASDVGWISQTLTITGPGVGAVVAYCVVTVLLLSVSPLLAGVVLLGVPLIAIIIGPLLGRLQGVQSEYRDQLGALTTQAGDIVSGLRVLCGIGGKSMFASRYRQRSRALQTEGFRVGAVTSWIAALTSGLPSLFLAVVTWLAARMAAEGEITIGQMVAVYGYVAVLVIPVSFFIEGIDDLGRGLVAARRVIRVLSLTPEVVDADDVAPGPAGPAALRDPDSGLTVPGGGMLVVAAAAPGDAVRLVDRLGRYGATDVTWGDVPIAAVAVEELRRRVLVADNDAYLFGGWLRETLTARRAPDEPDIIGALHVAAADDILAGLPAGLDSAIQAQGRNLSGGQRQRVRLAAALLVDPDVLMLVEPTSSVDAHTESLVAERLYHARAGRTTVIVSTSPLWLDRADRVAYLAAGRVVAAGTHSELLATQPDYRALVYRNAQFDPVESADPRRILPTRGAAR